MFTWHVITDLSLVNDAAPSDWDITLLTQHFVPEVTLLPLMIQGISKKTIMPLTSFFPLSFSPILLSFTNTNTRSDSTTTTTTTTNNTIELFNQTNQHRPSLPSLTPLMYVVEDFSGDGGFRFGLGRCMSSKYSS